MVFQKRRHITKLCLGNQNILQICLFRLLPGTQLLYHSKKDKKRNERVKVEREGKDRWGRRARHRQSDWLGMSRQSHCSKTTKTQSETGGGLRILGGNPEPHFITAKLVLSECKLPGRWLSGWVRFLLGQ